MWPKTKQNQSLISIVGKFFNKRTKWKLDDKILLPKVENNAINNLDYIDKKLDGSLQISFQPFRRPFFYYFVTASSNYQTLGSVFTSVSQNKFQNLDTQLIQVVIPRNINIDTPIYSVNTINIPACTSPAHDHSRELSCPT